MGITASYKQISEFEYATFKSSPRKAYHFLFGKTDLVGALKQFAQWTSTLTEKAREIQDPYAKTGLFDRLHAVGFDPSRLSEADREMFEEQQSLLHALHEKHKWQNREYFDIDKSWQAIHFLLTGQLEGGYPPLAWAVLGGTELPDHGDYTSGSPVRMLSVEQVQTIAQELEKISAEELLSRATVAEMISKGVRYVTDDDIGNRDYITHHYERLRDFYAEAAKQRNAILLWLS